MWSFVTRAYDIQNVGKEFRNNGHAVRIIINISDYSASPAGIYGLEVKLETGMRDLDGMKRGSCLGTKPISNRDSNKQWLLNLRSRLVNCWY